MSVITPKDCFHQPQVADLRLIACPGAEELTNLIDKHLVRWASEAGYQTDSFIIESACPRFQSGDAKGLVKESVRGDDIFIVVDPGNYSVTYKLFNYENHLSPDDHFANLKRLIQAVAGKAHRVSVIMPSLYGGRQHRRVSRESLDCAVALQELQAMGVKNIITFDAHDPRLMNAVPLMSFDNAMPTYQVLKNLLKKNPEISFDKDKFIVVSPDEGAMSRNMYFSSVLGCNLGMFYKRRDYTAWSMAATPSSLTSIWAIPSRARPSLSLTTSCFRREYAGSCHQPERARRKAHHRQRHLPALHQRPREIRQGCGRRHSGLRHRHQPDLPYA